MELARQYYSRTIMGIPDAGALYEEAREKMPRRVEWEGMTPFGRLLSSYMEREGLVQGELAAKLVENGYPHGMTQGKLSHLMHNYIRVYPALFDHLKDVLELTDEEKASLLWAYTIHPEEE